jgi:hypothetical protein
MKLKPMTEEELRARKNILPADREFIEKELGLLTDDPLEVNIVRGYMVRIWDEIIFNDIDELSGIAAAFLDGWNAALKDER